MNHSILHAPLLAVALAVSSFTIGRPSNCFSQTLSQADLIPVSRRCDDIIRLVHRHGVNQCRPITRTNQGLIHPQLGGVIIPADETGDLEIVSVHRMPRMEGCGPRVAIVIANQSCRCVEGVSVSAVALLGRIHPLSPSQCQRVAKVDAGQALQIELTLPIESLSMGRDAGSVIGLQRLLVVVDSNDQFVETDEANNLKAYVFAELPVLSAVAPTAAIPSAVEPATPTTPEAPAASLELGALPDSASTQAVEQGLAQQDPLATAISQIESVDG